MMEHRYRAWDRVKKKMSYYVSVYTEGDEWWWAADHVDPDTGDTICSFDDNAGELMQYTGQVDKNGKRIFAEDIITQHGFLKWEVRYNPKQCAFKYYSLGKYNISEDMLKSVVEVEDEVIGNIYEQPELMK